jgi:hypothetical protein
MATDQLSPQVQAAIVGVAGVMVTVFANVVFQLRQRKHERDTVITAIRSDVRSIVIAMTSTGIVESFVRTYQSPNENPDFPPWSDAPRGENYFKLYEGLAPQIGRLPAEIAKDVVKFYTYFRISRDAAAPLGSQTEREKRDGTHRRHAENVLKALREFFLAANRILDSEYSRTGNKEGQAEVQRMLKLIADTLAGDA